MASVARDFTWCGVNRKSMQPTVAQNTTTRSELIDFSVYELQNRTSFFWPMNTEKSFRAPVFMLCKFTPLVFLPIGLATHTRLPPISITEEQRYLVSFSNKWEAG